MDITIVNDSFSYDCLDIGSAEGFEFPQTNVALVRLSSKKGAHIIGSRPVERTLSWMGILKKTNTSSSIEEDRLDLISACKVIDCELKTLNFTSVCGTELQAEVEVKNLRLPQSPGSVIYQVEAVAPDWRFFSQLEKSVNTAPDPSPLIEANNVGNEVTNPRFIITGPGTSFTITNMTTGTSITVTYNLIDGEEIVINTLLRSITINGDSIYGSLSGSPITTFLLEPGINEIDFTATGDGANTDLEVRWRDAYYGI